MTNVLTSKPIQVETGEGGRWPHLRVPREQAEEISRLMTANGIWNEPDFFSVSIEGKPHMKTVWFSRYQDVAAIQAILDEYEA